MTREEVETWVGMVKEYERLKEIAEDLQEQAYIADREAVDMFSNLRNFERNLEIDIRDYTGRDYMLKVYEAMIN